MRVVEGQLLVQLLGERGELEGLSGDEAADQPARASLPGPLPGQRWGPTSPGFGHRGGDGRSVRPVVKIALRK